MGKLTVAEAGADADAGVIPGDVIATDQPEKAGDDLRGQPTAWFAGDEGAGERIQGGEDPAEGVILKVMEEKVGDDEVRPGGGRRLNPLEEVCFHDLDFPAEPGKIRERFRRNNRLQIEEGSADGMGPLAMETAGDLQEEGAIPGPEFQDGGGRFREPLDGIPDVGGVPHPAIEPLKIPARVDGGRMIRREGIEQFGF